MKNAALLLVVTMFTLTSCTSTNYSTRKHFNGLKPVEDQGYLAHLNTRQVGVHVLFGWIPLFGVITVPKTVDRFTADAKKIGAERFELSNTNRTVWWGAFPPLSFLITPVTVDVAGDAYDTDGVKGSAEEVEDVDQESGIG